MLPSLSCRKPTAALFMESSHRTANSSCRWTCIRSGFCKQRRQSHASTASVRSWLNFCSESSVNSVRNWGSDFVIYAKEVSLLDIIQIGCNCLLVMLTAFLLACYGVSAYFSLSEFKGPVWQLNYQDWAQFIQKIRAYLCFSVFVFMALWNTKAYFYVK